MIWIFKIPFKVKWSLIDITVLNNFINTSCFFGMMTLLFHIQLTSNTRGSYALQGQLNNSWKCENAREEWSHHIFIHPLRHIHGTNNNTSKRSSSILSIRLQTKHRRDTKTTQNLLSPSISSMNHTYGKRWTHDYSSLKGWRWNLNNDMQCFTWFF